MRIVVDTNALLSNIQQTRADHPRVRDALRALVQDGHELCTCPQILYEFYAVASRPAAENGLGMSPARAAATLDLLIASYVLLSEPADMLTRWKAFCKLDNVRGKRS